MNILVGTVLLVALAIWLWSKLPDQTARERALAEAKRLALFILPRITVALIGASLFADLLPEDRIRALFGSGTGAAGLFLAAVLGPFTPGGPFVCFAVAAAGLQVGATPQAVMAYVTSWSLFSLTKTLAYEVPLMGTRFTLNRFALSLPIPFVVAGAGYFVS